MSRTVVRRARPSHRHTPRLGPIADRPCACEPLERRLFLAFTFASPTTYTLSGGTFTGTDLGIGDFNRDGKPDAVVSYFGTPSSGGSEGGIAAFLNVGGGILGNPQRSTFSGLAGLKISVGDFNGDAIPDAALPFAGPFGASGVAALRGNGSGGFSIQGGQTIPFSANNAADMLAGDFNGDQLADAVLAISNSVSVYPGDATNGLGAPVHEPLPGIPLALTAADFNGDGRLDLAAANAANAVNILIGTGTGSFGSKPPISISVTGQVFVSEIVAGEFSGDGKADLVVGLSDGNARVLLGAGDGSFALLPGSLNTGAADPSLVVGDFDGDNRHDLVAAHRVNGDLRLLRGLGNGSFEAPQLILGPARQTIEIAAADFNGDGKLDLALGHGTAGVSVMLNTSPQGDVTPPTASLNAMDITQAGRYVGAVDVIYTDNVAINASTVGSGDITVTGPNGFNENSHIFTTTAVSGSELRARYYFNFPASGYWTSAANGTYTVSLNNSRVKDSNGNAAPGGVLGTFQVNIPVDTTPPQTVLAGAQNVTIGGGSTYRLSVIHSDNIALPSVIGEGAVVVRTPGGATLAQGFIYRIYPPPGPTLPYDYAYAAPGGTWDPTDNGTYTIELLPNALFDTSGNAAAARTLGTFQVNVQTGTASISASVYDDANADGVQGAGEVPLSFQQVYLDLNDNGMPDGGDPAKFTNSSGTATFADLPAGNYVLRAVPSDSVLFGQFQTSPAAEHRIALAQGTSAARAFGMSTLPGARGVEFVYQSAPHALKIIFNRNVSASLGMEDLSIVNLTSGQAVFPTGYRYDPVTPNQILYETATVTFAGVLPDGNYRVTINKPGVTDTQGRPLAGNAVFDFFVLAGDANRDRRVGFEDLVILAQNYSTTGKTFSQGNFSYDPGGSVDFQDLVILAQRYGTMLAPPVAASALEVPAAAAAARVRSQARPSVFRSESAPPIRRPAPAKTDPAKALSTRAGSAR